MTEKRKRYPVQLNAETHARLKKLAESKHWDLGYMIEYLITYYIKLENLDEAKEATK
jgi:predicted transcriptional regulator